MLLKSEIKVGEIYGYDVEENTSSLHKPTKTVKIIEITDQGYLLVECQQTGQLFTCGSHMLTTINRIKRMYEGYKNTVIDSKDTFENYVYNKTLQKMENILFQVELQDMAKSVL